MGKSFDAVKACFLSVLMSALLLLCPAEGFAAESDPAAEKGLESAYKAMEDVKSGSAEMNFLLKTMLADATGTLNMDFVAKPRAVLQGKLKLVVGDEKKPTEYEFYSMEDEKDCTLYYKDNEKKQWFKEVYSKDKEAAALKKEKEDPAYQALLEGLEACKEVVRFGESNDKQQTYLATLDGNKIGLLLGDYAKKKIKVEPKNEKDFQVALDALGSIGDVDYEVTVDKASNQVVAARTDLSKPLGNIVKSVMDNAAVEEKNKGIIALFLSNAQLAIDVKGGNYNQVAEIKIPESVIKKAKPVPKNTKEKQEKKEKK